MSQESIDDWNRMYKELTDPDLKLAARQKAERQARMEDKMRDTGAFI